MYSKKDDKVCPIKAILPPGHQPVSSDCYQKTKKPPSLVKNARDIILQFPFLSFPFLSPGEVSSGGKSLGKVLCVCLCVGEAKLRGKLRTPGSRKVLGVGGDHDGKT